MPSGGARNRSGPKPDPNSGRSDRRGYSLTALPTTYDGPVPEFPLSQASDRELELWEQKWRGPHGAAWSQPSEEWRLWDVALWVRTAVRCEDPEAPASILAQLNRLGDRAGLSTAGLAEMGWKVAVDEVGAKASIPKAEPARRSSRDRMKVVPGAAAGA
jgi:hypothetical protein